MMRMDFIARHSLYGMYPNPPKVKASSMYGKMNNDYADKCFKKDTKTSTFDKMSKDAISESLIRNTKTMINTKYGIMSGKLSIQQAYFLESAKSRGVSLLQHNDYIDTDIVTNI